MFIRTLLGSAATEYQNIVNLTLTTYILFQYWTNVYYFLPVSASKNSVCVVWQCYYVIPAWPWSSGGPGPGSLHCNNHCFLNQVSAVVWPQLWWWSCPLHHHLLLSPSASVLWYLLCWVLCRAVNDNIHSRSFITSRRRLFYFSQTSAFKIENLLRHFDKWACKLC